MRILDRLEATGFDVQPAPLARWSDAASIGGR
jgi:hypothetical protein